MHIIMVVSVRPSPTRPPYWGGGGERMRVEGGGGVSGARWVHGAR